MFLHPFQLSLLSSIYTTAFFSLHKVKKGRTFVWVPNCRSLPLRASVDLFAVRSRGIFHPRNGWKIPRPSSKPDDDAGASSRAASGNLTLRRNGATLSSCLLHPIKCIWPTSRSSPATANSRKRRSRITGRWNRVRQIVVSVRVWVLASN